MSESPAVTSPLIGRGENEANTSGDNLNGYPGVEIEISAKNEVELKAGKPKGESRPGWSMRYHDFVTSFPEAQNKTFSEVVENANDWLSKNSDVSVTSCEVVTWIQHGASRPIETEYMIATWRFAKDTQFRNIRGIRLWLVPRKSGEKQGKLCYMPICPEPGEASQDLLGKRLSHKLETGEISGRIVGITTEPLPVENDKIMTDIHGWLEQSNADEKFAYCLNVFHMDEGKAPKSVVMEDFLPKETVGGWESFEMVAERANTWLKQQHGARVVSLKSFDANKTSGSETFLDCYLTRPGVENFDSSECVRCLRVFVTHDNEMPGFNADRGAAFEQFQPKVITVKEAGSMKERGERMAEVFHRLAIYVETSDLEILGFETFYRMVHVVEGNDPESIDLTCKFIIYLRVYMTSSSALKRKNSVSRLSRAGSQNRRQGSFRRSDQRGKPKKQIAGNAEHPGPIFLRNVVNRRFKYRYLAFGVVGFVVMGLIVALSVIYSNT